MSREPFEVAARASARDAGRVWHGILDGTWRIVVAGGGEGRRVLVVRPAAVGEERPLSRRERWVLALAALGESNKAIGFALGIAPTTAADVLEAVRRKLGVGSRRDLIELFGAAAAAHPPPPSPPGSDRTARVPPRARRGSG